MQSKLMITSLSILLLSSGAAAQTISTSPVQGQQLQSGLSQIPNLPDLTIQVPVDVHALSGRVEAACIRCLVTLEHPDITPEGPGTNLGGYPVIVKRRELSLMARGYQGLVTFQIRVPDDLPSNLPRRDEWGPEHITYYQCHLLLCGPGAQNEETRFGDSNCEPPHTGWPEPDWLRADRSVPFRPFVSGSLQD